MDARLYGVLDSVALMSKVIDFHTREILDETYNVHEIAQDVLYLMDENLNLPNIPAALALMYLAYELLNYERRYLTSDMNYIEIAKMIDEAYR